MIPAGLTCHLSFKDNRDDLTMILLHIAYQIFWTDVLRQHTV